MLKPNRLLDGGVFDALRLLSCLPTILLVFSGCNSSDPLVDEPIERQLALPVNVIVAKRVENTGERRVFSGTVKAARSARLGFGRGGRIADIHIEEGDVVEANELLVELDNRRFEQKRDQLVAARDQARQNLADLPEKAPPLAPQELINGLTSIQGQVLELRNKLVQAAGAQPPQAVNTTQALSELEQRVSALNTSAIDRQRAELNRLIADLDRQIEDADLELEEGLMRAPFPGAISLLDVGLGTTVAAGMPVVRILDTSELRIAASVPSEIASELTVGESVPAEVGGESYSVTAHSVSAELDQTTKTRQATFVFNQSEIENILPGSVAHVEFVVAGGESGFWLPRTALARPFQGLWSVMVAESVDDGWLATRRYVKPDQLDAERVFVGGQLSEGEWVIANGIQRLVAGQRVSPQLLGSAEADVELKGTDRTDDAESELQDEGGEPGG